MSRFASRRRGSASPDGIAYRSFQIALPRRGLIGTEVSREIREGICLAHARMSRELALCLAPGGYLLHASGDRSYHAFLLMDV